LQDLRFSHGVTEVPHLWGYHNVPRGKELPNMTSQYAQAHSTKVMYLSHYLQYTAIIYRTQLYTSEVKNLAPAEKFQTYF
jgi:hypothetical protein